MQNRQLQELLSTPVSWLDDHGPDDDIVISSRIRLARNLQNTQFPVMRNMESLLHVRDLCTAAAAETETIADPLDLQYPELDPIGRSFLCERCLISRTFLNASQEAGLLAERDQSVSMMINEEDHLRLQILSPGLQLENEWEKLNALDDRLSTKLPFAFDKTFGFLTSSPSNLGTGMKASILLHLPGLVYSGQIKAVVQGLQKLGVSVAGFFGDSENTGSLFVLSNQSSLGETEQDILKRLTILAEQMVSHEKRTREELQSSRREFLTDKIGRAYGILRYCARISGKEAMNLLSALRLGVDLGMFRSIDIHTVNHLFIASQPAHLALREGRELSNDLRQSVRAALLRGILKNCQDSL